MSRFPRFGRCAAALLVLTASLPFIPAAGTARAAGFQLPPVTRVTLDNGLTVLVMPTRRLPLVDLRLVVRAGSVDDPAGKEGLAHLTADLMTQGAAARSAKQIAEDIEFVGGDLSAGADAERMVVTCEVLKKDLATGIEIFRDVIVQPTFGTAEFQRKKDEALAEIASERDDPATVANNQLLPFAWGRHPLGHPAIGWEPTVGTLTRDDVVGFHGRMVRPERAMLAVVGDVDPQAVIASIKTAFAGWKAGAGKTVESYSAPSLPVGRRILIVSKPEVTQTQIRFVCPGVPRNHPDYYPIRVANTILGSGFTSRLVNEIRVVQGLTYSIGSRFSMNRRAGLYGITTFTRNATLRKTIDATLVEARKLRETGPTEAELDKAKRYLTGQYPLGLQAPDDLAEALLDVEFYGLAPDYLQTFATRINAVTMDDARRALKSYFCVDELSILVVSNPETAKKDLEGLGPIEVKAIE
jgi:zinc protease